VESQRIITSISLARFSLSAPHIVLEYVEGETEFAPANLPDFLSQFAAHLSRIHQIEASKSEMAFLPKFEERVAKLLRGRLARVDEALDEGRIRSVLEKAWPFPQRNASVLLHGDFWPGNTLWKDGQLVAIIDWEDAASGDLSLTLPIAGSRFYGL
jgi:aminoglycoside phosphotransferase (APT) family kinase protein